MAASCITSLATHRPQQCRVQHIHPVCGGQQHHTSAPLKPVQLRQQLVQGLVAPAGGQIYPQQHTRNCNVSSCTHEHAALSSAATEHSRFCTNLGVYNHGS